MKSKNNNRGGINRVVLILLVLIIILLIVAAVPVSRAFRHQSEVIGCEQAMKTARDGLIIEYLNRYKEGSVEEARGTLNDVMPAREKICPTGGNVYLIKNDKGIYEPVCGLHDKDKALCTRLNASYALGQLTEARAKLISSGNPEPESVRITVNSKKLSCKRVKEEEMIHRGTDTTNGYKGTVSFYGVAGDFTFSARYARKGMGNVPDGDICYFVYADKNYCAIWRSNDGWSGDAYEVKK